MLDNIKFKITEQQIINRMTTQPNFEYYLKRDEKGRVMNCYHSLKHKTFGSKLSLDFTKVIDNGELIGYSDVQIIISPHYHFNQYHHNGNDFTPENCINSVSDILTYIGIKPNEYEDLKVVNLEFGLNLIPDAEIKTIINGLLFSKRTKFIVPDTKYPYSKKTDSTDYKRLKAYAKGLQFIEAPEYGIHPNTFRFEIKTKEAKYLRTDKIRIYNATDLLNLDVYSRLGQILLNEWETVLITNAKPDVTNLKSNDVKFINQAKNIDFWNKMIPKKKTQRQITQNETTQPKYRNKFSRYKQKYYKILGKNNNLHTQIKLHIIDKLFSLQSGANSTQTTPTNKGNIQSVKITHPLLNLETAPLFL